MARVGIASLALLATVALCLSLYFLPRLSHADGVVTTCATQTDLVIWLSRSAGDRGRWASQRAS